MPKPVLPTEAAIHSGHIQLMTHFMQLRGIVLSDVFEVEQLAIITEVMHHHRLQVPVRHLSLMLRQLADYLHEPDVVLDIGSLVTTAHLGIIGYLLHACATLEDALSSLSRYNKLIINALEGMHIDRLADSICLSWTLADHQDHLVLELGLAIMMQFTRQLTGQTVQVSEIHLIKPDKPQHQRYQHYFGCPVVRFDQPAMRIVFPARTLQIAIVKPDKTLLGILQQQADIALQSLPRLDDFIHQVQQQLALQCQDGQPTITRLASALHVSVRTVQRRLAEYGLSFQVILDQVRQQLCQQYLSQHIELSDIAQLLGYSDQSAFTRAFKRWTGTTPLQQRRRHGQLPPASA